MHWKHPLKDTLHLLKNTFTLFGRDHDLFKPGKELLLVTLFFNTILFTLFIVAFLIPEVWFGFFGLLIIGSPILMIYTTRQKAITTAMVNDVVRGKDATYAQGKQEIKGRKGIWLIAFIDVLVTYMPRKKGGILGFIIAILDAIFRQVWDLLEHYLVPAIVIDNIKMSEVWDKLKGLKNNVPGTLVGVFGIDFVSDGIKGYLILMSVLMLAIAGWLSWVLAPMISFLTIEVFWLPPLVLAALIIVILFTLVNVATEILKATYFTIFYVSIQDPMGLHKEWQQDLTHYLLFEKDAVHARPKDSYTARLADYITHTYEQGYNMEQIRTFLEKKGYPAKVLDDAFAVAQR